MSAAGREETRRIRKLQLLVLDKEGTPLAGAKAEIEVQGRQYGSFITSGRSARLTLTTSGVIGLRISYARILKIVEVSEGTDQIEIQLPVEPIIMFLQGPPIATCPDGRTGSPCVECRIGNDNIEICV